MYILVVAATSAEIDSTINWIRSSGSTINGNQLDYLITGVGQTATTYALTRQILHRKPDLLIQAGIGGSFNADFAPDNAVLVKEEVFADLGAFANDGFDDIFDLGLAAADENPFENRLLINPFIEQWKHLGLPAVRGATINCISSTRMQVHAITSKYAADVESMEGAAFHYVCLLQNLPFIQLRTISNFVGERDKSKWMLKEAIARLNIKLQELLMTC